MVGEGPHTTSAARANPRRNITCSPGRKAAGWAVQRFHLGKSKGALDTELYILVQALKLLEGRREAGQDYTETTRSPSGRHPPTGQSGETRWPTNGPGQRPSVRQTRCRGPPSVRQARLSCLGASRMRNRWTRPSRSTPTPSVSANTGPLGQEDPSGAGGPWRHDTASPYRDMQRSDPISATRSTGSNRAIAASLDIIWQLGVRPGTPRGRGCGRVLVSRAGERPEGQSDVWGREGDHKSILVLFPLFFFVISLP